MRIILAMLTGAVILSGVASAQTSASPAAQNEPKRGYAEGVFQSAFGNVTSQSFGGEVGATVLEGIQIFVDAGHVRDTAPSSLGSGAQAMAGFVSQTNSGVSFRAKQPVSFGIAGVRYVIPTSSQFEPYVMVGGGIARVTKDVSFTVAGTDVTNSLTQYGVVLGSDLAGTETKGMASVGLGVAWPVLQRFVVDLQYRYGRVLTSGKGLNLSRAGIGLGVRF